MSVRHVVRRNLGAKTVVDFRDSSGRRGGGFVASA
jgi:hypothetical protein